jgi:hypothetical protein
VSLRSAVKDEDSGTLISKGKNIRLETGMQMMIAAAPEAGASSDAG